MSSRRGSNSTAMSRPSHPMSRVRSTRRRPSSEGIARSTDCDGRGGGHVVGRVRRCMVLGPPGIGKTRLLAELAASAAHDGASVSYLSARDRPDPWVPDLDPSPVRPRRRRGRRRRARCRKVPLERHPQDPRARWSSRWTTRPSRTSCERFVHDAGEAVVRPAPLDLDGIREVAGLYLGASADALPASLLESTGGVPRRIHRQVSEWAFAEASRRAGAARVQGRRRAQRPALRRVRARRQRRRSPADP